MTAAGWYVDPHNDDSLRWWDGSDWTEHVRTRELDKSATDVVPAADGAARPRPKPVSRSQAKADETQSTEAEDASKASPNRVGRRQAKEDEKARKHAVAVAAATAQVAAIREGRAAGRWWAGIPNLMVGNPIYLGPQGKGKLTGILRLTDEGIRWHAGLSKIMIPWSVIEAVSIDGEVTKRVTVTRAVAVGVFALGAKKKREDCHLSIITATMEHAFVFEKTPALKIRNALRPVLNGLAARQTAAADAAKQTADADQPVPAVAASATFADELAKLADLRASGVLTDEEFAAAKARLLA